MPLFHSTPYAQPSPLGRHYRRLLARRPFLTFGLPFLLTMLLGSFFLTPATAVRYEKHDRKTHMLDREEALGLSRSREEVVGRGKRDVREEYARLAGLPSPSTGGESAGGESVGRFGTGVEVEEKKEEKRQRRKRTEKERIDWMERMAGKAQELADRDWEPKRVERLEGEPDGVVE